MAPRPCQIQYYITLKSHWMYSILNKRVLGHRKTWKNIQLPSVDHKMKKSNSVLSCHPSSGSSNQEVCGERGLPHCLHFKCWNPTLPYVSMFSKTTVVFINLSSSFRWTDDRSGIGTAIRVLYNFSKPAVTAVFCAVCPREINLLSQGILLSNIGGVHVDQ